jgi:tRNA G10  N-methylase Trm11
MQYFFILGTNPAISLAELYAVFDFQADKVILVQDKVLLWETEQKISAQAIIRRLGGTIKVGEIVAQGNRNDKGLINLLSELIEIPEEGKLYFGFSSYLKYFNAKPVAMELKKFFKEKGASVRWVISKETILSSVVVEQNHLADTGWDINLFDHQGQVFVGRTLAVQAFKELSARDYGRPARDDQSGMLPPKLAQIMINLAKSNEQSKLLDPFCGSGTVLMEAALMGIENIYGSDISKKAIEDTNINLGWINSQIQNRKSKIQIKVVSATELSKSVKINSIDAIVTEPYLGPQRGFVDVRSTVADLEKLYRASIEEFFKVLKPGGRVVMIWPVLKTKNDRIFLSSKLAGNFKIVPALPKELMSGNIKLTNRQTLMYGREGQRVWREVVILQK